jgi:hypothetical protein
MKHIDTQWTQYDSQMMPPTLQRDHSDVLLAMSLASLGGPTCVRGPEPDFFVISELDLFQRIKITVTYIRMKRSTYKRVGTVVVAC